MIETVRFYRASEHVFEFPLTDPVTVLCARSCEWCGANSKEVCAGDCPAAMAQVWETHGAIASCYVEGQPCAFCGGERNRCVPGVFAVQLLDGKTRRYRINDYALAALGAFTVYRTYIHTGVWSTRSTANAEDERKLPNQVGRGVGCEQNSHH